MAERSRAVLVTGATGLVGSYLLKVLLEQGRSVYALARSAAAKNASQRICDMLHFWGVAPDLARSSLLQVVEGDVGEESLGLSRSAGRAFLDLVTEVFHCAAVTDLNKPLDFLRNVNVEGTRRVLELAWKAQERDRRIRVHHVSTAYVYGSFEGKFTERDFEAGQTFDTNYERTKFEAEALAHEYSRRGLWVDVYRPPIVIGESSGGKTFQLKHIYQFAHLARQEIFDELPVKGAEVALVSVDALAYAIYALSQDPGAACGAVYHPFPARLVAVAEVLEAARKVWGFRMPRFVAREGFDVGRYTPAQRALLQTIFLSVNFKTGLDSAATNAMLRKLGVPMPQADEALLERCFRYAARRA